MKKKFLILGLIIMLFPAIVLAEDYEVGNATGSVSCTNESDNNYKCVVTINQGGTENETGITGVMGNISNGKITSVSGSVGTIADKLPTGEVSSGVESFKISFSETTLEKVSFILMVNSDNTEITLNTLVISYSDNSYTMNNLSAQLTKKEETKDETKSSNSTTNTTTSSTTNTTTSSTTTTKKRTANPKTANKNIAYFGILVVVFGVVGLIILNKKKLII